jgi:hypothetical protein
MVNVMPNQNPTSTLRPPRATIAMLAGVFLVLCASGTAYAAIQQAAADDSLLSPWTYSTVILVLMLLGLVVYRRRRVPDKLVEDDEPVKTPVRTIRSEKPQVVPARVAVESGTLSERRAPAIERRAPAIAGSQVWEKPSPETKTTVFGSYLNYQEDSKLTFGKHHRMDVME